MARTKRLAILAATVLIVGGCSGSTTAASTATTPGPSSVATRGATESSTLAALASQYTEIATSGQAAVAQCDKDKAAAVGSLVRSKAVAQECLTDYGSYVTELKAIDWGPAQPQADNVIESMNEIDALLAQMANAPTAATFRVEYDQLESDATQFLVNADALRAAMGLPPAP